MARVGGHGGAGSLAKTAATNSGTGRWQVGADLDVGQEHGGDAGD